MPENKWIRPRAPVTKTSLTIGVILIVFSSIFFSVHGYSTSLSSSTPSAALGAQAPLIPSVPYSNLRFVSYKLPPGTHSTVNAVDGQPGPDVYTGSVTLHNAGINGVRADGMSWTQREYLGTTNWQNAINYEATAFDLQGISVVWGLPIPDDVRGMLPDLLFYLPGGPSNYIFGGPLNGPSAQSAFNALFESDAIYWGKTTNIQPFTAANGTVYPAGYFSWPWASKYQGLPVWQAYAIGVVDSAVATLASHPSTYSIKLWNEPYTNYNWGSNSNLANYYSYIGQRVRADGWTSYIVFSALAVHPAVSDITSVAPKDSSGNYLKPLMFEIHYPTTTDLSTVQSAMSQMGGAPNYEGWNGEDWVTYLNGQNGGQPTAQQIASYGFSSTAFGFDLDCDGVDFSTSCQPLANGADGNMQLLISAFNSAYGQPIFFSTTSTSKTASTTSSTTTTTSTTQSTTSTTTTQSTTITSTSTSTTTTSTSEKSTSTSPSPAYITIQMSGGPYFVGSPVTFSGYTFGSGGIPSPSQTIYVRINGVNQGSVTSDSDGHWTFSYTPAQSGAYTTSASQLASGGGIASPGISWIVSSDSISATSRTTSSISSSTSSMKSTTVASTTQVTEIVTSNTISSSAFSSSSQTMFPTSDVSSSHTFSPTSSTPRTTSNNYLILTGVVVVAIALILGGITRSREKDPFHTKAKSRILKVQQTSMLPAVKSTFTTIRSSLTGTG